MTIVISGAGISGTSIEPDSPEWKDWFATQPEGTKIQFEWKDDSLIDRKFTAYRRKRYWEAQKRVDGKLRNTTIKPSEVTYENLRQMGLRLTAYNWTEKFDYEELAPTRHYQTLGELSSQTQNESEELKARIAELEAENHSFKERLHFAEFQVDQKDTYIRELHNELLSRPHPADLIRKKVAELGMQEQLMQHQADSKKAVRYWALAKLLESLED